MKTWEEMEPRERDVWVAEHVMGWEWIVMRVPEGPFRYLCPPDRETAEVCRIPEWVETSDHDWRGPRANGDERVTSQTGRMMRYTTDASADYEVLRHVRETWGPKAASEFMDGATSIWAARRAAMYRGLSYNDALMYEPGDYSHAAYLALTGGER